MGVNLEGYRKNVREIIDRCHAARAKVMLTTITPIREEPDFKLNITAHDDDAFLLGLAEERRLPIARLNEAMFAEIAKGTRLTSDGVHPLEPGHRVMAKKLDDRTRMVLFQAPHGDVERGTTLEDYRKSIVALVGAIRKIGKQPVLTTLALCGKDPSDDFNKSLEPYNEVMREVAKFSGVPLADVNLAMVGHLHAQPDVPLTFDGERFNREGSRLMVEAVLRATGRGEEITPELRAVWDKRPVYWVK